MLLLLAMAGCEEAVSKPDVDPIIGKWNVTNAGGDRLYVATFRDDGTWLRDGDADTAQEYEHDRKPTPYGWAESRPR